MPEALVTEDLWHEASRWVESNLGLHMTARQWPDLQRGMAAAAHRLGLADGAACARLVLTGGVGPEEQQVIAQCLTIGETYFFRDPGVFDAIATHVLRPLIAQRRATTRHLRVWSAGCATGQEAYSLAMLLASLIPDWPEWNIFILGTDINTAALAAARTGSYGRWSVRAALPAHALAFLRRDRQGNVRVDERLRRLVHFSPLNLAGEDYPSMAGRTADMDLVLCRNVLIYFSRQRVGKVLERLGRCLADQGWLVTGSVELPQLPPPGLARTGSGPFAALRRSGGDRPALAVPSPARAAGVIPPQQVPPSGSPPPPARPPLADAGAREAPPVEPSETLAAQARALADAGDLESAEDLCRRAIAQDKLNAEWTYLLASILLERGREPAAIAALERTLYLHQDHVLARFSLGTLALRQQNVAEARRHLSHALARLAGRPAGEVLQGSGGLTVRELQEAILLVGKDS